MRSWLRFGALVACACAIAVACGGSGSETGGGLVADAAMGAADTSTSDGASPSGDVSSDDGSSGDASSDDASSDDGPIPADATIDIPFPDVFYGPDAHDAGAADAGDAGSGCLPDGVTCQGGTAQTCSGGVLTTQACPKQCADGYGCVVCQPGSGSCSGNAGTQCKNDGSGYVTNNCDPDLGETCSGGACLGDCAEVGVSYIGCEYYAATMLNHLLDQNTFYFSVSVSNTSTKSATVKVTGGALGSPLSQTVAAGALVEIKLPWVKALSCGSGNSTGTCNGDSFNQPVPPGTEKVAGGAYHIKSTEPVTVYQFNPRDYQIGGAFSYTNDASLLVPINALTGTYRVAAWPTFYNWPGTIMVVATQNGTSVTIGAPSGTMQAGAGLGTSGGSISLNAGDALEIESGGFTGGASYGSDMSGTSVTATAPVEVFGGHSCVYISASTGYCDHMEEIMLPVETLRDDYVVSLPYNKNAGGRMYIKVVGVQSGTTVNFDPAVQSPVTIGAGQVVTFEATKSFHVWSSGKQPFVVTQYMEGQTNFGSNCTGGSAQDCGDPSESVGVATAQYRKDYQFIAPTSYAENWVNVIAKPGGTYSVDGTNIAGNQFTAVGNSGWSVAIVPLGSNSGGVHKASGDQPFGVTVYGYGAYTSFMYPGGLNLARQ